MFDKTITNADEFIEMPISSQVLYFHLSMNADDDGFINNWKGIMRMIGTKEDDLKVLIAKQFIIPFDSGVIVIKHWRINNFLRKDRHVNTKFQKELSMLDTNDSQEYVWLTSGQPSIDKKRIDKNRLYNIGFTKPTLEEVKNYCEERNNGINPEHFIDFYESKNWMIGKNKMKDWKAAIRTWESRNKKEVPNWFDKTNQMEELTEEEKKEMDDLLNI